MRLTISVLFLLGFIGFVFPKSVPNTVPLAILNHPSISIIGGTAAQAGDFPFLASLLFPINATIARLCGGTLIASSYILTAAHCVNGLPINASSGYVFINSLNINGGGNGSVSRRVSSYIAHQQFFMNNTIVTNDIALLVLNQPVTAADNISFVQLPTDSSVTTQKPTTTTSPKPTTTRKTTAQKPTTKTTIKTTTTTTKRTTTTKPVSTLKPITTSTKSPICSCTCAPPVVVNGKTTRKPLARLSRAFGTYSNASAIIAGWGVTASGSTSPTLQKANVTIYDNSICTSQWNNQFNGTNQLCAAQMNTATCFGDSGGPILVGGKLQVGVVSFGSGNGCADPNHVPVFARVSAYLGWIATTMAANPPPAAGK